MNETCWLQKHRFPLILCHSRMKKSPHLITNKKLCDKYSTVCQLEQVNYCLLDLPQIVHCE